VLSAGGVFESIATVFIIRHHACGFTHCSVVRVGVRVIIVFVESARQRVSRVASHRVVGSNNEVVVVKKCSAWYYMFGRWYNKGSILSVPCLVQNPSTSDDNVTVATMRTTAA